MTVAVCPEVPWVHPCRRVQKTTVKDVIKNSLGLTIVQAVHARSVGIHN